MSRLGSRGWHTRWTNWLLLCPWRAETHTHMDRAMKNTFSVPWILYPKPGPATQEEMGYSWIFCYLVMVFLWKRVKMVTSTSQSARPFDFAFQGARGTKDFKLLQTMLSPAVFSDILHVCFCICLVFNGFFTNDWQMWRTTATIPLCNWFFFSGGMSEEQKREHLIFNASI